VKVRQQLINSQSLLRKRKQQTKESEIQREKPVRQDTYKQERQQGEVLEQEAQYEAEREKGDTTT
jgi:hypothetical protein